MLRFCLRISFAVVDPQSSPTGAEPIIDFVVGGSFYQQRLQESCAIVEGSSFALGLSISSGRFWHQFELQFKTWPNKLLSCNRVLNEPLNCFTGREGVPKDQDGCLTIRMHDVTHKSNPSKMLLFLRMVGSKGREEDWVRVAEEDWGRVRPLDCSFVVRLNILNE